MACRRFGPGRLLRLLGVGLAALLMLVVVLVAIGIWYVRTENGRERLRRVVVERLRGALPGLSIGRLSGDFLHTLDVEQVVLRDRFGGEAVRIGALRLRYHLGGVWHRAVRIESVIVERPAVVLREARDGQLNLAALSAVTAQSAAEERVEPFSLPDWRVGVEQLRLSDASLRDERRPQGIALDRLSLVATAALRPAGVTVQLARLGLHLHLPDGRQADVSLSGAAQLTHGSEVEGKLALDLSGLTPQTARLALQLGGTMQQLRPQLEVALGRAGRLTLSGWVAPAAPLRYALKLEARQLRPRRLLARLPPARLNVAVELKGQGTPLSPRSSSELLLRLHNSSVAGVRIDHVSLAGRSEQDHWKVTKLRARAAQATIAGRGHGSLERIAASIKILVPDVSHVPRLVANGVIPRLAGALALDAAVKGRFDRFALHADGSIEQLEVGGNRLRELTLQAQLKGLPFRPTGEATLKASGIDIEEHLSAAAMPRSGRAAVVNQALRVRVDGLEVSFHGRPRSAALELKARARVHRLPPLQLQGSAKLTERRLAAQLHGQFGGMAGGVRASAELPIFLRRGAFVPQLRRSHALRAKATVTGLRLALLRQLDTQLPQLAGRLQLEAQLAGTMRAPRLQAKASLAGGQVGSFDQLAGDFGLQLDEELRVRVSARRASQPLLRMELESQLAGKAVVALGARPLANLRDRSVRLLLQAGPLDLDQLSLLDPSLSGLMGQVSADVNLHGTFGRPQAQVVMALQRVRASRRELGDARLVASLQAGPGGVMNTLRFDLAGRELLRGSGNIGGDLERLFAGARARQDLALDYHLALLPTPLVRLQGLDDVLRRFTGGIAAADLQLAGTLARPQGQWKARVERLKLDSGMLGDLRLDAQLAADGVVGKVALEQGAGAGRLTVDARVGLGGPRPELHAVASAERLRLDFLSALVPALERSGGQLSLRAELNQRASAERPQVAAQLQLSKGLIRLRGLSEWRGITLVADLNDSRARLQRLSLRSGSGRLEAKGSASLQQLRPQHFELQATARRFRLGVAPIARATLDGVLEARGEMKGSALDASVDLREGVLNVPKIDVGRSLHPSGSLSDVVFVDRAARAERARNKRAVASGAAASEPTVRLHARADALMVRGTDVDVEVETDLRVRLTGGQPRIFGQLAIRRGRVMILGNRYDVERAVVRFSGQRPPDPAIDVSLRRDFAETTVLVKLRGTLSDNKLELSSDPGGYDQSQLLSLIALGRIDPRAAESSGERGQAVAAAVSQAVLGLLAQQVATKVGIDVARVGIGQTVDDSTGEARLRAEAEIGKYITRRLYVAYRRVFGAADDENANEALSEYRISARWLLMALFGDRGVGNLDLVWTYRY